MNPENEQALLDECSMLRAEVERLKAQIQKWEEMNRVMNQRISDRLKNPMSPDARIHALEDGLEKAISWISENHESPDGYEPKIIKKLKKLLGDGGTAK